MTIKHFGLLLLLVFLAGSGPGDELDWNRVGPTAGSVREIIPDRNNPNVWYLVENQFSRLYKSVDNGETWKYTGYNRIRQIIVHSASSEVFILQNNDSPKSSLLSSTDFARTFQLRSANAPRNIFDHPTDPSILWGSGVDNGYDLSVSENRGKDWKGFTNLPYKLDKKYDIGGGLFSPDGYYLHSVLVSPFDTNTIFVATEVEFPASCSGYSIDLELVSTNGGKSWAFTESSVSRYIYDKAFPMRAFAVNFQEVRTLTKSGWKRLSQKRFTDIVSVPGRADQLFGLNRGRQWFSRDEGMNWRSIDLAPAGKAVVLQARNSPIGTLLAGTAGAGAFVIDNSWNWKEAHGLREARLSSVASAASSKILYVVADFRFLYRSTDSGQTWKNISDKLTILKNPDAFPRLVVNQKNGKHIFVIVNDRIFVSFNAGESWTSVAEPNLTRVFFSADSNSVYFSRPSHGYLFKSIDGGRTIAKLPAEYGTDKNTIFDLSVDPFNGYFYAATNRGLFLSKDGGRKAEQIATDLSPDCFHCLRFDQIVALPQRGQYLTQAESFLYKTTNQGVTWRKLSKLYEGEIYVGDARGQHLFLANDSLLESTDGGITWNNISTSIHPWLAPNPGHTVEEITDPRYHPIYAATSLGLFKSN